MLSVRQPWAWAILYAGKRVENRDWETEYRGRVWLHASKSGTLREYTESQEAIREITGIVCPAKKHLPLGCFVGGARIIGCELITHDDDEHDPWSVYGSYGFRLAERIWIARPTLPASGAQGLWYPEEEEESWLIKQAMTE